jgi:hypothetical protein
VAAPPSFHLPVSIFVKRMKQIWETIQHYVKHEIVLTSHRQMNITIKLLKVSKGIIKTALGAIGYIICEGEKRDPSLSTILYFRASPRYFDKYLEVLPLFAAT